MNRTEPASTRLLFVDMFRGLMVLIMVQGHVTNTTILPALRTSRPHHYLNLLNGMVAPGFIFIAGFAIALVLEKKWESFVRFEKPLWMQVRRLLFVLGVAFWLHLPVWSFRSMLGLSSESFLHFLRCDVLHLISLSLLMILFLTVFLRNKKAAMWMLFVLGLTNVFVTPFLYDIDGRDYLQPPLSDYINVKHGALFPLFPWSAFAFLGAFVSWIYQKARSSGRETLFFTVLAISGAIMFVSAFALFYAPWQYHTYADPSRSSPRHFMLKMGFNFLVLALFWRYERMRKPQESWLNTAGQESLLVYGLHLVIVYGACFTPWYIARDVGALLTHTQSFSISLLLISLMVVTALVWHGWKKRSLRTAKVFFYALFAIFFLRFFLW